MSEGDGEAQDESGGHRLPHRSCRVGDHGRPDHPNAHSDDELGREIDQDQRDCEIEPGEYGLRLDSADRRPKQRRHGEIECMCHHDVACGSEIERPPRKPGRTEGHDSRDGAARYLIEIEIPSIAEPAGRQQDGTVVDHQAVVPGTEKRNHGKGRQERGIATIRRRFHLLRTQAGIPAILHSPSESSIMLSMSETFFSPAFGDKTIASRAAD